MSIISEISYIDLNEPFCWAEKPRSAEAANQLVMMISGSGKISVCIGYHAGAVATGADWPSASGAYFSR